MLELCGKNMRELKKETPEDRFSVLTSLWLLEQMLHALHALHNTGFLHRCFSLPSLESRCSEM